MYLYIYMARCCDWRYLARSELPAVSRKKKNSVLFSYNKSFIDQACSVKMPGYLPRSFLRVYISTSTSPRSINAQQG